MPAKTSTIRGVVDLNYDELKMYRGQACCINDDIKIHVPTLGEICEFGEQEYLSMVYALCSVGADLKWQLDEIGIDYTTISDWELFVHIISKSLPKEKTHLLLGCKIDFPKYTVCKVKESDKLILFDTENNLMIDEGIYLDIVKHVRQMHYLKRNSEKPGNEATKRILIEDAKMEFERNKKNRRKSYLLPLISTMVNIEGFKRDDKSVFDMNIFAFMDSVQRVSRIKESGLLLQSGYSGFGVDLSKVNKDILNYMGELS